MAAKKPASKKPTAKATNKPTPAERAEKAENKARLMEAQVTRLKSLDKVGIGKQFGGFMSFLREQSVVGLAIGLVLGTQAKALVDQLVASFINPLVGLLLPGKGTLKDQVFTLDWNGKTAVFGWGGFVIALLTFVIVAAVVYYVFKGLKLDRLDKKKED